MGINTININPNSTYIPLTDSFDEILKSHCIIESVGLEMSEEDKNLPYLYWTPKLHKVSFKHRFIAGSSKCTTKDLSCLLTKVLTTVKDGLIRYCNTKTSCNRVNSIWIVKNSTSLDNWMSVQQHQFRHTTFQLCTHQPYSYPGGGASTSRPVNCSEL